jgi:hypothetical protein
LALTTAITPKVRLRVEDFCSVAAKCGEVLVLEFVNHCLAWLSRTIAVAVFLAHK